MLTARLEVRLDREYREKLDEIVRRRGASVSSLIREMIDRFYEEAELQERLAAVQRIADSQIEELPDPDELSRHWTSDVADTPIFVDANVPIHAGGAPHELKEPCVQVLALAARQPVFGGSIHAGREVSPLRW